MSLAAGAPEIAVGAALRARNATRALADAALEPVPGGLSNHAWKAESGGRSWFVRLGGPASATLGVDRGSECALLATAATAGLAPPLLDCEPSSGLLVAQFVQGSTWRLEDARVARNVARIAERLRVLHGLRPSAAVRSVDFAAQARSLEGQLRAVEPSPAWWPGEAAGLAGPEQRQVAPGPALARVATSAFGLLASRQPAPVPCHNDLHHLNLVDDGQRLWIVDWEYGGVGDAVFDLASLACQHEYTTADRELLLDAYGRGAGIDAAALDAACTAFDYVQWLWYLLWAARNPAARDDCVTRARVLAERLRAPAR